MKKESENKLNDLKDGQNSVHGEWRVVCNQVESPGHTRAARLLCSAVCLIRGEHVSQIIQCWGLHLLDYTNCPLQLLRLHFLHFGGRVHVEISDYFSYRFLYWLPASALLATSALLAASALLRISALLATLDLLAALGLLGVSGLLGWHVVEEEYLRTVLG